MFMFSKTHEGAENGKKISYTGNGRGNVNKGAIAWQMILGDLSDFFK